MGRTVLKKRHKLLVSLLLRVLLDTCPLLLSPSNKMELLPPMFLVSKISLIVQTLRMLSVDSTINHPPLKLSTPVLLSLIPSVPKPLVLVLSVKSSPLPVMLHPRPTLTSSTSVSSLVLLSLLLWLKTPLLTSTSRLLVWMLGWLLPLTKLLLVLLSSSVLLLLSRVSQLMLLNKFKWLLLVPLPLPLILHLLP